MKNIPPPPSDIDPRMIQFVEDFYHPILTKPELRFRETREPWQYAYIMYPYFTGSVREAYVEMPRDWDKTGLLSACAFAECLFKDGFVIRIYARDKDQAFVILDAIKRRLLMPNPGLEDGDTIKVNKFEIVFNVSHSLLIIEPSDAPGAYGKPQNKAIFEELHCWNLGSHSDLWNAVVTKGGTKKFIVTNPGPKKRGLCWERREHMRERAGVPDGEGSRSGGIGLKDGTFWYSAAHEPFLPSWLDEKKILAEANVPDGIIRRLHYCRWNESGDLFTEAQVNACKVHGASYADWQGERSLGAIGGLDFGLTHDWAAFAAVGRPPLGGGNPDDVRILGHHIWVPEGDGKQIQVADVEDVVSGKVTDWRLRKLIIERWQMSGTIQKFQRDLRGCETVDWVPSAQSVVAISRNLFTLVTNAYLKFPADDTLLANELLGLEAETSKARGGAADDFKIVWRRRAGGQGGHGDLTRAISMAAFHLVTTVQVRELSEIIKDIAGSGSLGDGNGVRGGGASTGRGDGRFDNSGIEGMLLSQGRGGDRDGSRGGDW